MNNMKTILLLPIAAATLFAAVSTVKADEPLLSPRAKANQPSKVFGLGSDADLVRGHNDPGVAAKAKASGGHSTIVGTSNNDPDLIRGQTTRAGSPKGIQQLRESGRDFQVAPLK
jgi:hypothetical protein